MLKKFIDFWRTQINSSKIHKKKMIQKRYKNYSPSVYHCILTLFSVGLFFFIILEESKQIKIILPNCNKISN